MEDYVLYYGKVTDVSEKRSAYTLKVKQSEQGASMLRAARRRPTDLLRLRETVPQVDPNPRRETGLPSTGLSKLLFHTITFQF